MREQSLLSRIRDRLFPRPLTEQERRQYLWLLWKGEHAIQALNDGDVNRAVEILRMKL